MIAIAGSIRRLAPLPDYPSRSSERTGVPPPAHSAVHPDYPLQPASPIYYNDSITGIDSTRRVRKRWNSPRLVSFWLSRTLNLQDQPGHKHLYRTTRPGVLSEPEYPLRITQPRNRVISCNRTQNPSRTNRPSSPNLLPGPLADY